MKTEKDAATRNLFQPRMNTNKHEFRRLHLRAATDEGRREHKEPKTGQSISTEGNKGNNDRKTTYPIV